MGFSQRWLLNAAGSFLDSFRFFSAWVRNPKAVAAVAPSSRSLAALITSNVTSRTGPVLELGPGTGVFTQALIERGTKEDDLTLVEYGSSFVRLLQRRYPKATVHHMNAMDIPALAAADPTRFGAVICGLGLRNMRCREVEVILRGAFARMHSDAGFYLFTYGLRCSVPDVLLMRLGLTASRVGTTFRNLPPASVYRIVRSTSVGS
ncbi:SAM-dependent methyltransferase [Sphingobium lactosutens]|nr:SAM-dependent methyltransferase [Sphingobium lactosutens]